MSKTDINLFCYLTNKFENWDVDCEYNRDLENPKECSYNSNETKYIRPDIIIHQRNIKNNLLVIEECSPKLIFDFSSNNFLA